MFENKRMQQLHGAWSQFDPSQLLTAEIAVVTSGDPASSSGRAIYVCFAPGIVKRFTTYEDFENELSAATEEIQKAFTAEIRSAINAAITATNAANAAQKAANAAAEAANKAAEAAGAYVLGDISNKTVDFLPAAVRAGLESGDSMAVAFGKLAKLYADLDEHAYHTPITDLIATVPGYALDATAGRLLKEQLDQQNTNIAGKAPSVHYHDDRYYTEAEVNNLIANITNNYANKNAQNTFGAIQRIISNVGVSSGTYNNAGLVLIADNANATGYRASVGFHNGNNCGVALWLHTDGRLRCTTNGGAEYRLAYSSEIPTAVKTWTGNLTSDANGQVDIPVTNAISVICNTGYHFITHSYQDRKGRLYEHTTTSPRCLKNSTVNVMIFYI